MKFEERRNQQERMDEITARINLILAEFNLQDKLQPQDINEEVIVKLQSFDLRPDQRQTVGELLEYVIELQQYELYMARPEQQELTKELNNFQL